MKTDFLKKNGLYAGFYSSILNMHAYAYWIIKALQITVIPIQLTLFIFFL